MEKWVLVWLAPSVLALEASPSPGSLGPWGTVRDSPNWEGFLAFPGYSQHGHATAAMESCASLQACPRVANHHRRCPAAQQGVNGPVWTSESETFTGK